MTNNDLITTQQQVIDLFDYKDGNLYWRINPRKIGQQIKPGSLAGTLACGKKYIAVQYKRKRYFAHRLIFLYHHGWIPEQIDHIDTNPSNNKIENLRAATPTQNQYNRPVQKNNVLGVKNVSKSGNKYYVGFTINGKFTRVGSFHSIEDAKAAAEEFRAKLHGEFACHG